MGLAEKGMVETPTSDPYCPLTLPVAAGDDECAERWEDEAAVSGTEGCDVDALG